MSRKKLQMPTSNTMESLCHHVTPGTGFPLTFATNLATSPSSTRASSGTRSKHGGTGPEDSSANLTGAANSLF